MVSRYSAILLTGVMLAPLATADEMNPSSFSKSYIINADIGKGKYSGVTEKYRYLQLDKTLFNDENQKITLSDGTVIKYTEYGDGHGYKLLFDIGGKGIYLIKNIYHNPSGTLRSQTSIFANIKINTDRYYDEQGNLKKTIFRTPDNWVNKLSEITTENHVDMFDRMQINLYEGHYKKQHVLSVSHSNGNMIRAGMSPTLYADYFIYLDFETLEPVISGEYIKQEGVYLGNDRMGKFPFYAPW